jgi:hypothetical protein
MGVFARATTVALALSVWAGLSSTVRAEGPDLDATRAACRAALASGDQAIAREACKRAFLMGGTPEDMHNRVQALVEGPARPLMEDLVSASFLADGAVRVAPAQPWGYLARSEIARRLCDRDMLDAAIADLRRVAPADEVTQRAIALSEPRVSIWVWLERLGLGLALVGTAAHSLWRWWRARAAGTRLPAASVALVILLAGVPRAFAEPLVAAPTQAQVQDRPDDMPATPIDDAHPESSIPSLQDQLKNPLKFGYLLQDLLAKAKQAGERGDHAAAARFYEALIKAVPTRSYAFSKLCEERLAQADRPGAIEACRTALFKEGVNVADYGRFVGLVLAKTGPLSGDERQELEAVLTHLDADPTAAVPAEQMRCQVALRVNDVAALEACTAALAKSAPADAITVSFQWALALAKGDHAGAARLVERARAAGMASDGLARMEKLTSGLGWSRFGRAMLWALGGAIALALLGLGARRLLNRRQVPA